MKKQNSFKEIIEEEEKNLVPPPSIHNKLVGSVSFINFFARMVEMYVPRIMEVAVEMLGGSNRELPPPDRKDFLAEADADSESDNENLTPGEN